VACLSKLESNNNFHRTMNIDGIGGSRTDALRTLRNYTQKNSSPNKAVINKINLEPLYEAIEKHQMIDAWQGSVLGAFDSPEEHANKKLVAAKQSFTRMMKSPKNDGSTDYQLWAISAALGLKFTRGYSAQATGKEHWQSWGAGAKKRRKNKRAPRSK
uniref:hypothetical protein n=1 Tax=Thaumasiovibrio sp. DFM-14 TaxID=3384792 RepID=UPI0039A0FD79